MVSDVLDDHGHTILETIGRRGLRIGTVAVLSGARFICWASATINASRVSAVVVVEVEAALARPDVPRTMATAVKDTFEEETHLCQRYDFRHEPSDNRI